jgi:hypothetical protein
MDEKNHSKDCEDMYKKDDINRTTPEIHLFCEQSKSDVLKMFKQIEEDRKNQAGKARPLSDPTLSIKDVPETNKPHLLYEDAKSFGDSTWYGLKHNLNLEHIKEPSAETPETIAVWRKLSGVRPEENIEAAKKVPTIMDTILLMCKRNFVSGLTVEWCSDHWNPSLVINGAKTKIRSADLVAALEGLQHITDEDDAARIVSDVVVKKLERLFI